MYILKEHLAVPDMENDTGRYWCQGYTTYMKYTDVWRNDLRDPHGVYRFP
jgi:hypothetical protein